jgi:hypothetical protein
MKRVKKAGAFPAFFLSTGRIMGYDIDFAERATFSGR